MTDASPAAWHPDPYGRHELRYWDGAQLDRARVVPRQAVDRSAGGRRPRAHGEPGHREGRARRRHRRCRHRRDGRRHDLRRAGAGGEPEGQDHRDQQRVRDLRPARHADRRDPPGRPVGREEGPAGARQRRPVLHPQAAGRRHAGQRPPGADPPGQGDEVEGHRPGRAWHRGRADRAAEHDRQDPLRPRGQRSHLRLDQRRELAGVELQRARTTPATRSPASPRPGRASARRCSPRPTTSWCRSTARSRIPCAPSSWPAALAVDTALKQDNRGFG